VNPLLEITMDVNLGWKVADPDFDREYTEGVPLCAVRKLSTMSRLEEVQSPQ